MKVSPKKHVISRQELGRLGNPNKLTRYTFYALVFAFPWESLDIGLGENFSLSKLVGLFFFGAAFLQPKICFRFPPKEFWLFLLYLALYALGAIGGDPKYDRALIIKGLSIFQMLVLFWLSYNVMHDKRVVKGFFLAFISACLSLTVGGLFLEGVSSGRRASGMDEERLMTLGVDPNTTGATFALGLIGIIGLAYGRQERDIKTRFFIWMPFLILAGFLVKTGSRGAMIALVIGFAFFLFKGGNIRVKMGLGLILSIGIMALVWLILSSETSKRFENTLNEGHTSGRDLIYSEGIGMVNEKPLMGWGPGVYSFELGNRVGRYGKARDPHNLFLKLLLEVGILGTIPYLLGLGLCFWAAWKARNGREGSLPVSILVTVLIINMSITWDGRKIFWIILAYALVSASHAHMVRSFKGNSYSRQKLGVGSNKSSKKTGSPIVIGQSH